MMGVLSEDMKKELEEAGINIIGCCGTTPDHIRTFVHELRG